MEHRGFYSDDRNAQVDYLKELLAEFAFASDDPTAEPRERIDYYCTEFADVLPPWFDDHDREWLIEQMETDYA